MRSLTLLRHAKAVETTALLDDHERSLTDIGRSAASAVGRATADASPNLVLCSSARRTVETLEAVAGCWKRQPEVSIERGLYLATSAFIRRRVASVPDDILDVWVIGHNPGLYELARELAARADAITGRPDVSRFPTACRANFMIEGSTWAAFAEGKITLSGWTHAT